MVREARLDAVRARIRRIGEQRDLSPVLEPGALGEARPLAEYAESGDAEVAFTLGWFHWYRYAALPAGEDEKDLAAAQAAFKVCFVVGAPELSDLPEEVVPSLADDLEPHAVGLLERTQFSPDPGLLSGSVQLWERIVDSTPDGHPRRAGRLFHLGVALQDLHTLLDDAAALDAAIEAWRKSAAIGPARHPARAGRLTNLGNALRIRFDQTHVPTDMETAIAVLHEAIDVSIDDFDRASALFTLGVTMHSGFMRTCQPADLNAAIEHLRKAAAIVPPDHPKQPQMLSLYQETLQLQSELPAADAGVSDAIERLRVAADAAADMSSRAMRQFELGDALLVRFLQTGVVADADAAIGCFREALAAAPPGHPHRASILGHLGEALRIRFDRLDEPEDLNASIDCFRESVDAAVDADDRAARRCHLGNALNQRGQRTRTLADVDAAIDALRQSVAAAPSVPSERPDHPDRAVRLYKLGEAMWSHFELTGAMADLDAAIDHFREAAVAAPVDHPERIDILTAFGGALSKRSEQMGRVADADAAIECLTEALALAPPEEPDRLRVLNNLAGALRSRFELTGVMAYLDAAIDRFREAAAAAHDADDRAMTLTNLGNAFRERGERLAAVADADAAVDCLTEAVGFTSADDPHRAMRLSKLGIALRSRYDRTKVPEDLNAAINCLRQAVGFAHGLPDRAGILTNLGGALKRRFAQTDESADLDAAIDCLTEAVETAPADNLIRAVLLNNLGDALRTRFGRVGASADLDTAIDRLAEAVAATPAQHPDRTLSLSNLADMLQARYGRNRGAADLDEAISCRLKASKVKAAAPAIRLRESALAAALLAASGGARAAANAAENAVLLLPQLAPRRLERGDQQFAIAQFAGLVGDAAALALAAPDGTAAGRAERALGLLETGRAVLLSQALETRNDLTDLRAHHPELAARFADLRDRLDSPASTDTAALAAAAGNEPAQGGPSRERHLLAGEFSDLLEKIRGLKGFHTFALPPAMDELRAQAAHGPVVVFNISQYRSDALLLTRGGVASLNLPGLAYGPLIERILTFQQALQEASGDDAEKRVAAQRTINGVLEWLWDVAAGPVLDALGFHGQPEGASHGPEDWPRVWWVPGGLLGLLPLHAAGHHTDPGGRSRRRTVMDRVVSSYTPTIRALRHARERGRTAAASEAAHSLIVAMPTTPGLPRQGRLDFVEDEVEAVRKWLPGAVLLQEPNTDTVPPAGPSSALPMKAHVLRWLPECAIAHFSCHGSSDPTDPSRSLLLLHDHADAPLTVASLASANLGKARLAYLSACRTAAIDTAQLLDEAIHLSSAFQLAGFPHVIGTLWEIDDELSATVADLFYTGLGQSSGTLDPDRAAHALHHAVRSIRDGSSPQAAQDLTGLPSLWAAYMHAGA
ncbi:CHAT domain-containing protein [Streptomyces sp. NPDC008240]|uniref:CHAT domain-containing tetratricopeptide repeat protein n=1 Tax=Streptomyces sp. NPDC008240 TaxID=3364822 RepID=UPI0036DFF5E7